MRARASLIDKRACLDNPAVGLAVRKLLGNLVVHCWRWVLASGSLERCQCIRALELRLVACELDECVAELQNIEAATFTEKKSKKSMTVQGNKEGGGRDSHRDRLQYRQDALPDRA